jgi:hypothetical protein
MTGAGLRPVSSERSNMKNTAIRPAASGLVQPVQQRVHRRAAVHALVAQQHHVAAGVQRLAAASV